MSELTSLLNKAEDLTSALSGASGELRSILKDAEELQDLLDEYEPTLQETLKTVSSLSVSANKTHPGHAKAGHRHRGAAEGSGHTAGCRYEAVP